MTLAITMTRAQLGVDAPPVTVETHISSGLPRTTVVGMAETAVRESRDRVRSALINAHFDYPDGRITINLAPADLPKESGRYDLPIALGMLAASDQLPPGALEGFEFLGELSLDGQIRPVKGALAATVAATRCARTIVLPADNAPEAARVPGACVIPVNSILQTCAHLRGETLIEPARPDENTSTAACQPDLADVLGQESAKRALEIAASGGLNMLMCGPPGTGKSMLASRLPGILPPLGDEEWLETATVHSAFGGDCPARLQRPFRQPHRSASSVALVGGGAMPRPGEISLAHNGVLFLDELPEWPRHHLELLREPIESGELVIARALHRVRMPARFQLIAAMNPCPCGYAGSPVKACRCSPAQVARYQQRLSGPLLDRFDLLLRVETPESNGLSHATLPSTPESPAVATRVLESRQRQLDRQGCINRDLGGALLGRHVRLPQSAQTLMEQSIKRFALSARACHRLLRCARTIGDLDGRDTLRDEDILEALAYRLQWSG